MQTNQTMNSVRQTSANSDFDSPEIQAGLRQLEQQVAQFMRLLNDEAALMKIRNAEDLPSLVKRKNEAVGALTQSEPLLRRLLDAHADEEAVGKLRQDLETCQEMNLLNKAVAMTELNATRKSLELLRSLQRMDDLPLYGAAGKLNVVREKRDLGEA